VHVRAYLPSRLLPAIPLLLVAAAAVVLWGVVIRTLREVEPVPSPRHASAVVWADRVFQSPAELRRWLRARGGHYDAWRRAHPSAWATLEHRALPNAAPAVPAATAKPPRTVGKTPPVVKSTARPKPARRALPAATNVAPGKSGFARFAIVLMGILATLCLVAAGLPASVGRRAPALGRLVFGRRPFLLAAAAAVYVGLVVGLVQR
jgi:hypothetical protein